MTETTTAKQPVPLNTVVRVLNAIVAESHKNVMADLGLTRKDSKKLREALKAAVKNVDTSALSVKSSKKKPNGLKRPQNSYMIFSNEQRPLLRKKFPDLKVSEIAKKLGAKWRKMSAKQKKVYQVKEKKLRAAYDKEVAKLSA